MFCPVGEMSWAHVGRGASRWVPSTRIDPERTVVRLHSFEGRSFGSIAREMGMTDWSAARRVFLRALRSLGDMLVS